MVDFQYDCSISEASTQLLFEVSCEYPPTTLVDRLLSVIGAPALIIVDRLSNSSNVSHVVRELLILTKQRMASRSSRLAPTFVLGVMLCYMAT
jgi:hypothetical protein